ncbi:hypothetical protein ABPG72_015960, partial [Tetrahymena utriculariae]
NNNQILKKICQQVVLKFQIDQVNSLLLIENLPPFSMIYQVQNQNVASPFLYPQYTLVPSQQCTQNNCQSCIIQQNNGVYISVCKKCVIGFYLDIQNQCQSCNSTCFQCELGALDIYGKKIYYYELPTEQRQNLASSQLYPLCQICKNNYIISYDLISCDQCGNNCSTCLYTNGFNYYNVGQKNNIQLSQTEYQSLKIFKQCYTCQSPQLTTQPNGSQYFKQTYSFLIFKTQQLGSDCGQSIFNCQQHTLINKQTNLIDLIYNLAYYQNGSTSNSTLICAYCQDKYILSPSKQICTKNGNILDNSCLKFDSDNKSCQLCQTFALDQKNKVCDQTIRCILAVSGCSKCFYQNLKQSSNIVTQLFTCVQCQQDNFMTTLLGCVKCFDGCSQCYEIGYDDQQRKFNITANIIYGQTAYDIDTRLNYKTILKAQTFCSSCQEGYYFDPILKICTLLPCGQLCENCVFQINKFYCLQCNQTAVLYSISQISLFLGEFYFGQNFIPQDVQISTLSADQGSCQVCPYLCETCDQSSNLFDTTYSIYQTQCFSCKNIQQLSTASKNIVNDFQNYEIRYDKERFKCTLCKIGDQSCYFKKVTTIYAVCLDSQNNIGRGTYNDPFNINMITEVNNLDNIIIGESNFDLAVVALNEIALKELELQIIFPSKISVCQTLKSLVIQSNLQKQIKSLEIFHLNISYQQVNNQQFYFLQAYPTIIQGFTNVTISNINIDSYSSYFDQFNIGFKIYSSPLNQVFLNNVNFNRGLLGPQNVLLLLINNLQNSLILQNVTFNNLLYNNTQAIQLQYSQISIKPNLQIQLESVNIINVFFNASNFIRITQNNTVLNVNNCQIISCQLDYSSILFQQLAISQKFTQQLSVINLNLKNNQILNYSVIFSGNQFKNVDFSNIYINSNNLYLKTQSLGQSPSLFQLNRIKVKFISIQNNTIFQYVIFNSLKQSSSLASQIHLVDVQFYQNNITNNDFIFLIDSGQVIDQFGIFATKIYDNQIIQNPLTVPQGFIFIGLSNVNFLTAQDTELNNSNEIQFLKVLQVNNLKVNGLKSVQIQSKGNNNQILYIKCLYNSIVIKNIYFENLIFYKSLISIILNQSRNPQKTSQILLIQDFKIINCIANITQMQFSNAPIQITSQIQETIVISNFIVQGSQLQYSIRANEVQSKIASCAYLEALIGNIEINNSRFLNNYSQQKNNCLVINAQQLTINNSIFKNDEHSGFDFSNTTVMGGFLLSSVQSLYIKQSNFQGGRAKQGGALYLTFSNIGFLNIQDCSFVNNMSFNQFDSENNGGAIYIDTQLCHFSAQIYTVSFQQNIAFYQGGAIFVQNSQYKKVFDIADSQFIDNFSQKGTAVYFDFNQKHKNIFFLQSCIISYNRINISQNILIKFVRKFLKQQKFQYLFFLKGFFEILFKQSQFMMDETQVNQVQQNYFGLNNFFYIENVNSFSDYNNQYQDITYYDSLIKLINVQQINIYSSQFTRIFSKLATNFIQMNSDFIQINEVQFNNNYCLNCNTGLLQLYANYVIILNSQFEQNYVYDKGALYVQQIINKNLNNKFRNLQVIADLNYHILLIGLKFKNNFSQLSGGAIYVDTSNTTLQNCTFINNKAFQGNGGAIYYKGIEQITNLKIKASIFMLNFAQIGGAIYSASGQAIQNLYTQNIFQNNVAQKFSFNVYKYPYRLNLMMNGTQLNNNFIYHVSGSIKDEISLQFMTEDNEYFKEFPETATLNIRLNDTKNANLNVYQLTQKDGNFKLNNLTLNGIFGATVKLTFLSELIKFPQYDTVIGELITYNSTLNSLELVVQFVYNCELGYQHYKVQNFDFCQRCQNPFYNTFPGQKCIKCPVYGELCDGGAIYLREGYWRKNLSSTDIFPCNSQVNSCIGDIDIYQKKGTRNPEIRYCQQGFIGPLCSDCDVYGIYWKDSYVQNGNQNCTKDQCYDIFQQKCQLIDGQIYIGREKQQGLCISDSTLYNQVDFCQSKQNTVCMTKQKNQCIQIFNEDKYKAIQEESNICLGLNENFSNRFQIQALSFIKLGYCQDLRGTIKSGKIQENPSQYYLCDEKFKLFGVGLCDSSNQCYNQLIGSCINLIEFAAGITVDGICVFPNNYFTQKVICNQNYCLYENYQKKQSCQPYNQSNLIFGKTKSNQCVYFYQQTMDLQMICKNSFCRYLKNFKATCISIEGSISPKVTGFTHEGDCIIEDQQISQSLIITCVKSHSKIKSQLYQKCVQQDNTINQMPTKNLPAQNRLLSFCGTWFGCFDQNSNQCIYIFNNGDYQDICILNSYCQYMSSSLYIGRDNKFQCLQNMQSSSNGVNMCFYSPDEVCVKGDGSQCILYSSSQIYLGYIVSYGVCAQQDQNTSSSYTPQSLVNLNPNYCQDSSSVIRKIIFPIIGRDGSPQQNCFMFTCGSGYCIYQQSCQPLGFDGVSIAKLSNGYCGQAYQSGAIQCAYPSYQICLSGNTCLWLNVNNYQASGVDSQGSCLSREQFTSSIGICEQHHCIKPSSDNTQFACFLLDGSKGQVGISPSGACLDLNQSPAIRCVQNNNNICYDSDTQQCWLTVNFQQINSGCTLNQLCYQLSNSQYVGRDKNLHCLTNTQQTSQGIDICFNDPQSICLATGSNPFCVIYPQSTQYLGYIIENKQCAQINQKTLSGSQANLVNLRIGYCQDQNGYIRQLNSNGYVGVDSFRYTCLLQNQTTSTQIIQCYSGFCISTNKCQAYDQTNIRRDANYYCLTEGTAISTECSFDVQVCFDPIVQACFYINDNNPNYSGRAQNGQCAIRSQYYPQILSCAYNHCKTKMDPTNPNSPEGCFPFDVSVQRVGIDVDGYCVLQDIPNAVRCMKGQFCLDYQNGYSCKSLIFSKNLQRYARQKDTQYCLPYLDINGKGDLIETCVTSTCIYTYFKTMKNYCLTEGTLAKGDFIVGTDVLGYCVLQDQLTTIQISTCLGITYCILNVDGQQKCQYLQDFDPDYPNLVYRAKNVNQLCQDLNTENSIGCMDGLYCINTLDNSQCEAMISPTDFNKIGRDDKTQICLPQGIQQPNKCQKEYCISQGVCIPLQNKFPGKELITHMCLAEKLSGKQGASNCFQNGYCLLTDSTGKFSYYKLDFTNPNLIGIQKDTQTCLKEKQTIAIMCASGLYCLDRNTQSCIVIDVSKSMCVDSDGYCVTNGSCNSCKFNQCISTTIKNTCQDLVQSSITYCTDNLGFCSSLSNKNCVFCPNNYCMINNNGVCLTSVDLLKLLVGNSCFVQNQSNSSCVMKNLDIPDSNGNMYCTNNESFCQTISTNNSLCLLCPKYYTNPGNDICYSLSQKSDLSPNPQQLYFDMQLTYVKQDCYDQQYCLLDSTKKCSSGCFSCTSQNFCTQCQQGYFLFQKSTNTQICLQCTQEQYQITDTSPYFQNPPTYTCLDCSSEYGSWSQNTANTYKTCINYLIHYGNATQIVGSRLQSNNFIVTSNQQYYVLNHYNSSLCPTGCLSCVQNSTNSASCISCEIGYVLYFGDCVKCPNNCDVCQYASFITGYAQLITQINFDPSKMSFYNFILICLKCQFKFLVSYDLQSCQPCGINCDYCQYENKEEVLNYDIKVSRILSQSQLIQKDYIKKCYNCTEGYFLNSDGVTCIQNLQYCSYCTTLVTQGSQSVDFTEKLWEFQQSQTSSQIQFICKQCIDGYIISKNQLSCIFGCRFNQQLAKCSNCLISANNDNQCLFCNNGNILNLAIYPPKCQDDICQQNIYGCLECYSYFDHQNVQLYQCTKCDDQCSVPTINGCKKCPLGCSKCYEGTRTYNFTSYLIYQRQKYSVQERLSYNNTQTNYQLFCTECQAGYYFDQQLKQCLQIQCGQNCLQCALINDKPQCIKCNYDKLLSLVNQFSYFIGILYFKQSQIPNIQDMVTLTQSGNDCQLCPIMCETCINNQDLNLNPLYLYDAQCLSCKKNILQGQQHLKNYQIVNDKSRRKCYLCQMSEKGCFYKKQKTIYTQCLDINSKLGDGSLQNPVNYNRLNEVNIDMLILSEIEYNQAIVYYNELQVKQLEVKLIFLGDQCVEAKPQTFKTTLKMQIKSLQLISINVTSITNKPPTPIQFLQLNITFSSVKFYNIKILKSNELVKIQNYVQDSQINLIMDSIIFNNVLFDDSKIITLNTQNIMIQLANIFFNLSKLDYNSLLLDLEPNNLSQQMIDIQLSNIQFSQTYILEGSQILNNNFLNTLKINNFTIYQCNIQQMSNQKKPLFTSNTFIINAFQIYQSTVQNQYFIEQQDSKLNSKDFVQSSYFQNINILDNKIIASAYCFLGFSTNKNSNSYINSFMLVRNILESENIQAFVYYSNLNTIKIQNVTMIDNNQFIFLDSEKITNVFISQVILSQVQKQYVAPQICQLNQILNYISIQDINLQNIIINTNIISIVSSEVSLNNINPFNNNQSILSGISIRKVTSSQLSLLVLNTIQNSAPIFINSKQDTTISIDEIDFSQTQSIMNTSQTTLGYISLGFYFKAPTVSIIFKKANFIDQDARSIFSWIQGVTKSISFDQCNFTNSLQADQIDYFKNKQLKKGGHIYLQSETYSAQYSRFVNGFALNGGSIYWIAKNFGKMFIFNCTLDSNTAFSYDDYESEGGAIFIDNQISASLEIIIEKSFFFSNFAQSKGGAIQFVQTSLPRTAVFFLDTQFINNLSSQGSNFNIENSKTSKTIVVMKNVDSLNQIDFMLKKIQLIVPLLSSFSWQESQYQQSSIFYLNNAYDVQIFNSKFQISSNNIQIIDSSNNYQYSHYLDNLVIISQAQELYTYNSTLQHNQNILEFLNTPNQNMLISTVKVIFLNNHANIKGGAIFIKQAPLIIISSNFINNLATNQGGAIYLENNQLDILQNTLNLMSSSFVRNQAQLGGAISSSIGQSVNNYQSNTFSQNQASIYGSNIQVSPNQLNVYIDGTLQKFTQKQTQQIIISNHQGGFIKQNIVFKFSTEQQEEIVNLSSNITLNVKLQNGQGYLNKNILQQQNGVFNLTKQIQIYGIMGQQITLSITSDLIQMPQYNSSNYIIGYDKNYQLILIIQFARTCPIGLVKKYIYGQFNYCFPCQDSYSFTNSDTCLKCPSIDVKCIGNQIFLPSNYWRVNQQSAQLFDCKNCIGDYQFNPSQIQVSKEKKILSDQNYYCQIGYIGALCEDCDISGEYWGKQYFMNLDQKCQKCSNINLAQILYPLCFCLATLLMITTMTQSYQEQIRNKLLYITCQNLFKKQILYFQQNSVNVLKLFLFQSFIIGTVFYYDQNTPNILSQVLIDLGNLFISSVRLSDCFLGQQTQVNILMKSIIFYLSLWLLILLCIILISLTKKVCFKFRFLAYELKLSTWIFAYHSQNAILSKLFKLIKCQNFDTQSFVTDYLSQYCDATQLKLSNYVFAPLYILTLLIPQTLLLYKLHKRRYFLKNYKNKIIYGYFTQDYKQKFFFWDQVKLTYKITLGIIAMFSYQFNQLQTILSIIVSLTLALQKELAELN